MDPPEKLDTAVTQKRGRGRPPKREHEAGQPAPRPGEREAGKAEGGYGVDDRTEPNMHGMKKSTGYFLFMSLHRAKTQEEWPSLKIGELAKKLGEAWGALSDEEKQSYKDRAAAGEGATVAKAPKEKQPRMKVDADAPAPRSGPDNLIPAKLLQEVLQLDASRCKDPNRGRVSPEALALLRSASTNMLRGVAMEAASKTSLGESVHVSLDNIKRVCKREEFNYLGDALDTLTSAVAGNLYDAFGETVDVTSEEPRVSSDPTPAKVDAPRKRAAAAEPKPAKKPKRKAAPAGSDSQQKLTCFVKREQGK
jgi:hypothetical protein